MNSNLTDNKISCNYYFMLIIFYVNNKDKKLFKSLLLFISFVDPNKLFYLI